MEILGLAFYSVTGLGGLLIFIIGVVSGIRGELSPNKNRGAGHYRISFFIVACAGLALFFLGIIGWIIIMK